MQVENRRIYESEEPTCIHLFRKCAPCIFVFLWLLTKTMIYMLILAVSTYSVFGVGGGEGGGGEGGGVNLLPLIDSIKTSISIDDLYN